MGRSADGTREWKQTLPNGAVQTHGEFLALHGAGQEAEPYSFAWLPTFRALANELLDPDPTRALEAFQRASARMNEGAMQGMVSRLNGMDPMTSISLAAGVLTADMRLRWIRLLAEAFDLDAPLPNTEADLRGLVPTAYLESIVQYDENQLEREWSFDFTRRVLDGTLDETALTQALTRKLFKGFWQLNLSGFGGAQQAA